MVKKCGRSEGAERSESRLSAPSRDAQNHKEQVNEIQIEGKSSHNGRFGERFVVQSHLAYLFYLLRVISGETNKNQDADIGGDIHERRASKKNINDGRQDEANERHKTQIADRSKIFFRRITVKTHDTKVSGRHEKGRGDR